MLPQSVLMVSGVSDSFWNGVCRAELLRLSTESLVPGSLRKRKSTWWVKICAPLMKTEISETAQYNNKNDSG